MRHQLLSFFLFLAIPQCESTFSEIPITGHKGCAIKNTIEQEAKTERDLRKDPRDREIDATSSASAAGCCRRDASFAKLPIVLLFFSFLRSHSQIAKTCAKFWLQPQLRYQICSWQYDWTKAIGCFNSFDQLWTKKILDCELN
jgi:hypothetical protein